jgi:hypothetical protein
MVFFLLVKFYVIEILLFDIHFLLTYFPTESAFALSLKKPRNKKLC